MIIPIGIDCGNADFLKKNNLRSCSFPFDWVVTYNGVSKIIENGFLNYIPTDNFNFNSIYDVRFVHNNFNATEKDTLFRRIERFKNILKTTNEKITFIRKGHAFHHHGECNNFNSDIDDAENLDIILNKKYPNLKYEIIVILVCSKCFDPNETYTSISSNVKIYNIATPEVDDLKYVNLCFNIFKDFERIKHN